MGQRGISKSEARISKQSPKAQKAERFETALPFWSFFPLGDSNLFRTSDFGFRIYCTLLPLAALACFVSFSSAAKAQASTDTPAVASHSSLDGVDCAAYEVAEEPIQVCDNFPNPWNDLDEISLPSDDKAILPSRNDHLFSSFRLHPSSFSLTRGVGTVPAFLFPAHSSDSLREQIRERAPPVLA